MRAMTAADADRVLQIYGDGISTGHATFATRAPTWEAWDAAHLPSPRLLHAGGWAALSPYSSRHVYRGIAEVSLYVAADARGQGIGGLLLAELIARSSVAGIWTLQAGIFPENVASLALFQRHGFRVVGVRERLGLMKLGPLAGQWRDVVLLERRI
jgi:L-amino acid N-acyltransferase YncA